MTTGSRPRAAAGANRRGFGPPASLLYSVLATAITTKVEPIEALDSSAVENDSCSSIASLDGVGHRADPVDDRQDRGHQPRTGGAAPGAHFGERVLRSVAQRFEPGEVEETAVALYGVDEAKNAVETRAIIGRGFPGDNLPAQGFKHFPAFGYEIGNQIVHRREAFAIVVASLLADKWLKRR